MPDDKPKFGSIGAFQKSGPNLLGIFGSWGKYGVLEVYADRLGIRRGFIASKTSEYIYFKDIVSFSMPSLGKAGGLDICPWLEVEYRDHENLKKFEFTSTSNRYIEIVMIRDELEKNVKKREQDYSERQD